MADKFSSSGTEVLMPRGFSPGQMMSLVILERFALMDREEIIANFDVLPAMFDLAKEHYKKQTLFDSKHVQDLANDNRRLRNAAGARARRRDAPRRRFSEAQIDCILRLMTCGLATPEQVCEMFGLSIATIHRWSASMSDPRNE